MKKAKASPATIPTYHAYRRANMTINGNSYKGYIYTISDKLTNDDKKELSNKFNNIVFLFSQCQYAPEIVYNAIFVSDRVINN